MRIRYFLYCLLLASPLVAQPPLSAIDWLSKENSKFQRSILEVKNVDVEKANEINVSTLNPNEYQAVGLLPIYVTGIPTTIWRNSSTWNACFYNFVGRDAYESNGTSFSTAFT